jgi:hypothetical protein
MMEDFRKWLAEQSLRPMTTWEYINCAKNALKLFDKLCATEMKAWGEIKR